MRVATPCDIFVFFAGMYSALEGVAAFGTDDVTGETITVLVFVLPLLDAFFSCVLCNNVGNGIEIFTTDNCLVMIHYHVLVFISIINMTVEMIVGVCFLKNDIAYIFFVD